MLSRPLEEPFFKEGEWLHAFLYRIDLAVDGKPFRVYLTDEDVIQLLHLPDEVLVFGFFVPD